MGVIGDTSALKVNVVLTNSERNDRQYYTVMLLINDEYVLLDRNDINSLIAELALKSNDAVRKSRVLNNI